jgi:hypothetical protein
MALPGEGFIALWNDVVPKREDYGAWHTKEHVPQRMTVEGFLRAFRYVLIAGTLPQYFTLYALRELAALESSAYLQLVDEPTPWSRHMRPDMRNFIRRICRTGVTLGGGVGGFAAVGLSTSDDFRSAASVCASLSTMDGVSGTHFGAVDPVAPPFNVGVQPGLLPFEPRGLFVVEGYDEDKLTESCARATALVPQTLQAWSFYKLAFELRKDDLADLKFSLPAQLDPSIHSSGPSQ